MGSLDAWGLMFFTNNKITSNATFVVISLLKQLLLPLSYFLVWHSVSAKFNIRDQVFTEIIYRTDHEFAYLLVY